jgi:ribosomal protein S18 acetylase RimI-like enzyme
MGSGLGVVRWTTGRLRIGPWHDEDGVASVAPVGDGGDLQPDAVDEALVRLADAGYHTAITSAVGPVEARAFLLAGFEVHERLHLLARDLRNLPAAPPAALRRARRRDHDRVLEIDRAAFDDFWRLDRSGLVDALDATPASRFRVAVSPADDERIIGYAVCGRAGRRGFVQRLAVDPGEQSRGVGTALLVDGLGWLRRRGATRAVVNTQESNEGAVRLYERLGFDRQPGGLAVLRKHW